ncbi:penicillin-binding protein 2, partial [filamentous cyanobacterium CCP1]
QGLVQATPLELAVMVASIANGGYRVQPHLLTSQTKTPATQREATGLSAETIAAIRSGLVAAVQQGTAQRLNDGSIPLTAGKTGTSEVIGPQPHALFVGFGPVENPQIAIAVIVENGGYGGVTAIPVAHEVYKVFFKQMGVQPVTN